MKKPRLRLEKLLERSRIEDNKNIEYLNSQTLKHYQQSSYNN